MGSINVIFQASAVHRSKQQRRLLASATSRIQKNSWERQELNPGLLVQSKNAIHCAMWPPNIGNVYEKIWGQRSAEEAFALPSQPSCIQISLPVKLNAQKISLFYDRSVL